MKLFTLILEQSYGQISSDFKEYIKNKLNISDDTIVKIFVFIIINTLKKSSNFRLSFLNKNENGLFDKIFEKYKEYIILINQYLNSIQKSSLKNASVNFSQMDLIELYDISNNWKDTIEKGKTKKEFGSKVLIDYRKNGVGYYWIYIEDKNNCELEGKLVKHCGNSESGYYLSLHSQDIYGNIDGHVTIDINLNEGENYQTRGKNNTGDVLKYMKYIVDAYEKLNLDYSLASETLLPYFLKNGYVNKEHVNKKFQSHTFLSRLIFQNENIDYIVESFYDLPNFKRSLGDYTISTILSKSNDPERIISLLGKKGKSFIQNISLNAIGMLLDSLTRRSTVNSLFKIIFKKSNTFRSDFMYFTTISRFLESSDNKDEIMRMIIEDKFFHENVDSHDFYYIIIKSENNVEYIKKLLTYKSFINNLVSKNRINWIWYGIESPELIINEIMKNKYIIQKLKYNQIFEMIKDTEKPNVILKTLGEKGVNFIQTMEKNPHHFIDLLQKTKNPYQFYVSLGEVGKNILKKLNSLGIENITKSRKNVTLIKKILYKEGLIKFDDIYN